MRQEQWNELTNEEKIKRISMYQDFAKYDDNKEIRDAYFNWVWNALT